MGPKSPETSIPQNTTLLTKTITESLRTAREVTVRADNIGAEKWAEMLAGTQTDGKERGLIVFRSPLSNSKFSTSKIVIGENTHVTPQYSDIGFKFLHSVAAKIHTHTKSPEVEHLKTLPPGDTDLQLFFADNYSAMVSIDHGGAHLLVRTEEPITTELPPKDIIARTISEVAARNGLVEDVQKRLNGILNQYGISYFYTENLMPSEDNTITFRKPE